MRWFRACQIVLGEQAQRSVAHFVQARSQSRLTWIPIFALINLFQDFLLVTDRFTERHVLPLVERMWAKAPPRSAPTV
jgi:hypothetical protein